MTSSARALKDLEPGLGRDLHLDYALGGGFYESADLSTVRSGGTGADLAVASGLDNLTQALANRLKTRRGELGELGFPGYGSRHHELIGQPNVERTRNLIKLYVLQALRDEPRVERVLSAEVAAEHAPPRASVRIILALRVAGSPDPLTLSVPFSLDTSV